MAPERRGRGAGKFRRRIEFSRRGGRSYYPVRGGARPPREQADGAQVLGGDGVPAAPTAGWPHSVLPSYTFYKEGEAGSLSGVGVDVVWCGGDSGVGGAGILISFRCECLGTSDVIQSQCLSDDLADCCKTTCSKSPYIESRHICFIRPITNFVVFFSLFSLPRY